MDVFYQFRTGEIELATDLVIGDCVTADLGVDASLADHEELGRFFNAYGRVVFRCKELLFSGEIFNFSPYRIELFMQAHDSLGQVVVGYLRGHVCI